MPISTACASSWCAASRTLPISDSRSFSSRRRQSLEKSIGSRLNSRLKRPSSVVKWGSSISSSSSSAIGAGRQ